MFVVSRIQINKENLNKELFDDVIFIVCSVAGAMFGEGDVRFISLNGPEYYFNYIDGELKYDEVAQVFPVLKEAFKKDCNVPEGWHRLYLGLGSTMVIKDTVYPAFEKQLKNLPSDQPIYPNWIRLVHNTKKSIKGE